MNEGNLELNLKYHGIEKMLTIRYFTPSNITINVIKILKLCCKLLQNDFLTNFLLQMVFQIFTTQIKAYLK